jgi:hypothetical protein
MITFIATAFEEKHDAHVFIGSMLCQKNPNWKAIIYANGHNQYISNLISEINDERLIYRFSIENTGYWGCFNRIKALEEVDTEYVVQTSIQDYYTPNAVEEILTRDEDLIYWNCLHNHFGHNVLETKLELNHIDWGCFAIKSSSQFNKINNPTSFGADGLFIEQAKNGGITNCKIDKILTCHN